MANYRACLQESRDLVHLFLCLCVLVSPGLLMTGGEGLFRYVCALVMPEGGIWTGWVSESFCLYKYALGSHSLAKMCLFVCVHAICVCTSSWRHCSQTSYRLLLASRVAMETSGVREEQHLRGVCQDRFSFFCLCLLFLFQSRGQTQLLCNIDADWS